MEEVIKNLPPSALVVFAISLAVLFAVQYLGLLKGKTAPVEKSAAAATVAAVIVDSAALVAATKAVEAMNFTLIDLNHKLRDVVEEMKEVKDEMRIRREVDSMLNRR